MVGGILFWCDFGMSVLLWTESHNDVKCVNLFKYYKNISLIKYYLLVQLRFVSLYHFVLRFKKKTEMDKYKCFQVGRSLLFIKNIY